MPNNFDRVELRRLGQAILRRERRFVREKLSIPGFMGERPSDHRKRSLARLVLGGTAAERAAAIWGSKSEDEVLGV